ncbi:serine hydrolase [Streptomyces sp. NA04227]|uniref:serine hydrolase n=1 Tax=Streptomyces sp. NA04227 TaxID=2742136 RepID=UPI001590569F|nr:serine hydrolase [Streptomyces sp. NA04227]QKW08804.1 serine hydrolase [Streptomyces sp. NA04227]
MSHVPPRRARILAGTLTASVLVPLAACASATAATGTEGRGGAERQGPRVACASGQAGLAERLERDIDRALHGRAGTVAVSVHDPGTRTSCALHAKSAFDSASIVKVTVLAALLRTAEQEHRALTAEERDRAEAMITESDNKATSALWKQLGRERIQDFLDAAGMRDTVPGPGRFWGLTRVTAEDEQRLLDLITRANPVLSDASRARLLEDMAAVVPDQRWGTPAGAPATELAHLKNGWLEREKQGWRVHSIGAFQGAGRAYTMTVLTQGNKNFAYGVDTIEGVARAVHKELGNADAPARALPLLQPVRPPALLAQ